MPVYAFTQGNAMLEWIPTILIATAGVLAGTFGGVRLLRHIPQQIFRRLVAVLIALLGVYMLVRGLLDIA
jgi:uncharacterized membrane protein YfcA